MPAVYLSKQQEREVNMKNRKLFWLICFLLSALSGALASGITIALAYAIK